MNGHGRVALLAGATGLVGGELLRQLLEEPRWERVVSIGRREVDVRHDKLEQRIAQLPVVGELPQVDDVFCALGTTIRKAGSQAAFRTVDHDAVVALARAARDHGASGFLHVTAMGADPGSRVFYNRVKGETERDVAEVGVPTTVAFRPSILDGERDESRPAERVGLVVMRALGPVLGRLRPTRAEDVARAMIREAERLEPGTRVVGAAEITRLAR
ncbi:MAG: nucleoside-diphosphate sugar epimerase [Marmoricola sp.]|nr:nucleoside-diphosphate sugar epimerase [Marmoricola sp.]